MKKIGTYLILGLLLLNGCGKQIPNDIIQPEEMEKVLYDYHLAKGMSSSESSLEKEAYLNFVFKKHGITKTEFDSSMVWYTRKSSELAEIYQNISDRFKKEEDYIHLLIGDQADSERISEAGDSVDLWNNAPLYWLTEAPLSNQLRFEIKPDSNFYAKDRFVWHANYTLLSASQATMGMNLLFDNDSVIGKTLTINKSGEQTLELRPDSAYKLKSINGFVFVHADSIQTPNVLINDLSLMRYHTANDSTLTKTSLSIHLQENESQEISK